MSASVISLEEEQQNSCTVEDTCRRIPPLWPLQNFVAVNPFLGLSGMRFEKAARLLERVAHSAPLMDSDYYLNQVEGGFVSSSHIRAALLESGMAAQPADPVSWLKDRLGMENRARRIDTVADWLDRTRGTSWAPFVVDEISKWCSSYFDRGQSTWLMPWKDLPLYRAWKRAAEIDANPEVFGLVEFRKLVRELPEAEEDAIAFALRRLNIPSHLAGDFLQRELMSVFGWSAYAAFHDRQASSHGAVRQLLAIRLAYDLALLPLCESWQCEASGTSAGFTEAKYIAHLALEYAYRSSLLAKLRDSGPAALSTGRASLQAVFCIDVRSEVYRRALEAQATSIETAGFAGFFGMAIEVASTARCPVLIAPSHQVDVESTVSRPSRVASHATAIWKQLLHSAAACFSSVEVGGLWFGFRMLQRLTRDRHGTTAQEPLRWAISLPDRIELAAGALKNMSLDASRLAPVVLLCGHGSRTENNPYGSSLDCGACGGHKGDINARFAAALFNDPAVRKGLQRRGTTIPEDTVFVGALHNTTTDDVQLYDSEQLLTGHQRAEIERWLRSASMAARRERAQGLPGSGVPAGDPHLEKEAQRRSQDWSEVRPEWGLAGNAAFIAAPRSRTRQLNLEGRVFLHEYDAQADQDGSVLRLILTAPVIVASWINLQYFGSTVDNRTFGSGNKVLHNVVGTFGVWEGNGGDLKTGLPLQSLHDGERWMHQPLRLHVVIEAPRERIDEVLRVSQDIRNLVENRWIFLLAIDDSCVYECRAAGEWRRLTYGVR